MNISNASSSDGSWSCSESGDSTDNSSDYLEKLKTCDLEPLISGGDTADKDVIGLSSTVIKTPKGTKCGKCKFMLTNAESLCCCEKTKVSDETLGGSFLLNEISQMRAYLERCILSRLI